jgi:proton-dependent oligopeptide transporter, POT family
MCLGLTQFALGGGRLGAAGLPRGKARLDRSDWLQVAGLSLAMIPLVYAATTAWNGIGPAWRELGAMGRFGAAAAIAAALWMAGRRGGHVRGAPADPLTSEEWQRILAIFILGFFVVFFWMGFEQAGGTMNLFADRLTDRRMGSWEIPASYFQSINPLGILAMGPGIAAIWLRVDRSRFALPTPAKMALGLLFLALGFTVLAIGQHRAELAGKVGPQWLFFVYVLNTIGELCLSPVGLSMVTKLAPARVAALMMGIWYLANAAANYLAGILEELLKATSFPLYWFLVGSSVGAGIVLLALTPLIKRLMRGRG